MDCGWEVAPPREKADVDAGAGAAVFAPPRLPNKLPPNPPEGVGCDVPDGAPVEAPRPENKLGEVPEDVVVVPPNSGLKAGVPEVDAPLEAGWPVPRLAKSDIWALCVALAVLIALRSRKQKRRARSGSSRTDHHKLIRAASQAHSVVVTVKAVIPFELEQLRILLNGSNCQ